MQGFLRDAGLVVQYLNKDVAVAAGYAVPTYTDDLLHRIARNARALVATCAARGWTAMTRLMLQAITADGQTPAVAVAGVDAFCPRGMTLLHLAVGRGSPALIDALADWGREVGMTWNLDVHGERNITPLHLVAMLPQCDNMRKALARKYCCRCCRSWAAHVQCNPGSKSLLTQHRACPYPYPHPPDLF